MIKEKCRLCHKKVESLTNKITTIAFSAYADASYFL